MRPSENAWQPFQTGITLFAATLALAALAFRSFTGLRSGTAFTFAALALARFLLHRHFRRRRLRRLDLAAHQNQRAGQCHQSRSGFHISVSFQTYRGIKQTENKIFCRIKQCLTVSDGLIAPAEKQIVQRKTAHALQSQRQQRHQINQCHFVAVVAHVITVAAVHRRPCHRR